MTVFRTSRFRQLYLTDTLWTFLRMLICVGPGIWLALIFSGSQKQMLSSMAPFPDNPETQAVIRISEFMYVSFVILGTGVWSLLQIVSRSPISRAGSRNWLTIHGWDGDYRGSPARTQVPFLEWFGLLSISLWALTMAPTCCALPPLAWAVFRSGYLATRTPIKLSGPTPAFFSIMLLTSATILTMNYAFVSLLFAASVIGCVLISERKLQAHIADESMMSDWQRESTERTPARRNSTESRMLTFSPLGPDISDSRPSRKNALLVAATLTALLYSVLIQHRRYTLFPGSDPKFDEMLIVGAYGSAVFCGFARLFLWTGGVWLPRMGPLSRLRSWRWIVPSYDVVIVPLLLNLLLLTGCSFVPGWPNPELTSAAFFGILLLSFRAGPPKDHWQMTSDARLSTALQGK